MLTLGGDEPFVRMRGEEDHLSLLESQKNRLDESQRMAERSGNICKE